MANIILLDGSKGAGKTTVGEMLTQRLKDSTYLSLDNEKHALNNQERSRTELNAEAFENLLKKSSEYLDRGITPIIDCGLTDERTLRIEALAVEKNSKAYKFLLKASYETQLNRVRSRDASRGHGTDEARFAEVHSVIHSKDFTGFTVIETDSLTPNEIADKITVLITP